MSDETEEQFRARERKEILKKLSKRKFFLLNKEPVERYSNTYWLIGEIAKGKNKVGFINTESYCHRYGMDTISTLKEGSIFPWVKNHSEENHLTDEIFEGMKKDFEGFERFDYNIIKQIRD